MSDVLAAFLYAQLEVWQTIQARRKQIWEYYERNLRVWAAEQGALCPTIPPHCDQAYHMYYLVLRSLEERQALIAHLKARGILSVFHYLPLHLSPMGVRLGGKNADCPVTVDRSDRLLRLPFYNSFTQQQQDLVIQAVYEFHGGKSK
jgi:dTDP-4-amino-4,6-dideoxygalactose transaminase